MKKADMIQTTECASPEEAIVRKVQLSGFTQSLAIHARLVNTNAELTKRPLQRFRDAVRDAIVIGRQAEEQLAPRATLANRIAVIRNEAAALLDLDPSLKWGMGLVIKCCESIMLALERPESGSSEPQLDSSEASQVFAHRVALLNEIDDLSSKAHAFGDHLHGGMEDRETLFATISQFRGAVAGKLPEEDPAPYVQRVLEIKDLCRTQSQLRSVVTGEGFNYRPLEANVAQCDKLIRLLESKQQVPQRETIPVISPRQAKSRTLLTRQFGWETA